MSSAIGGEKMKKILVVSLLIIMVLISGCYGPKTAAPSTATQPTAANSVEIKGFAFNPGAITVAKGTTVTWTNAPVDFDSGRMSKGDTFSQTFDTAGTYEYYCSIHPNMKGKVIVTE